MSTTIDGSASVTINSGAILGITSGTAVASTSGTSIDFTSIPSWVKRITVMFNGVSTSGTATLRIQIGVGSTPDTTSYVSASSIITTVVTSTTSTSGFDFVGADASYVRNGLLTITNISGNNWVASGLITNSTTLALTSTCAGTHSTASALGMVRITTSNGTDTFDAGSINILYE